MNIFVAGLMMETSSFSAVPTTGAAFHNALYYKPDHLSPDPEPEAYSLLGYGTFLRKAKEKGYGAYTSLHAYAEPAAPCRQADYEKLRDEVLTDLERACPVGMVLLFLHGAQMAQGYDDCEGDIISRARDIVGPDTFIGVELDLHANVSQLMMDKADALVACRLYPHTDFDNRAEHLFDIGDRYMRGAISTRHHFCRVPMLGTFYTTLPQMQAVNTLADELEQRPEIHSVSIVHGFPWADQPDTGAGIVVVSEADCHTVGEPMTALAQAFFDAREETRALRQPIDDILDAIDVHPSEKPFVIADAADNAGGGAGSDSTFILRRLIERDVGNVALGMIWDPVAVNFAHDAGVGNTLRMRLGGKTGPAAGDPLDIEGTVLALSDGFKQEDPEPGTFFDVGRAALIETKGVKIVVNSIRQQVFDPACFTSLGIDLASMDIIVVKSTQHFYERFARIAAKVYYCETPGLLSLDFQAENYARLQRPIWPIDAEMKFVAGN
ncbi:MAG: M81 family metallopeptidase [Sphingobium sp.]